MKINNLNRFFISLFLLANLLVFSSCKKRSQVEDFNQYITTQIRKTDFMPSQTDLLKTGKDVVVFEFEVPDSAKDYKKDLSIYSKSVIENSLSEMKWVNILDRNLFNKTKDEIKLIEMDSLSSQNFKTLKKADYIVYGSVTNLSFSGQDIGVPISQYLGYAGLLIMQTAAFFFSKHGGVSVFIWPKLESYYKYKINLEGNIKIIDTNSNMEIKTINFSESKEWKEVNSGNQMKNYDPVEINSTLETAIKSKKNEIKKLIPIAGYVAERKDLDNDTDSLIKLNRGSNFGVEEGMTFICEDKFKSMDHLTGIENIESKKIKGIMSDQITEKEAWMIVSKKEIDFLKIGNLCYLTN